MSILPTTSNYLASPCEFFIWVCVSSFWCIFQEIRNYLSINFNFSKICWQSIWSILVWSIIATHRTSSLTIPKIQRSKLWNTVIFTVFCLFQSLNSSFDPFILNGSKRTVSVDYDRIHMKILLKHQEWKS